jgi:hypothetical protein
MAPGPNEPATEVSVLALGEAVVRLLRRLSGRAGCLLVLEDLHWADAETLAVVEYWKSAFFNGPNWDRLVHLKRRVDPDNFFRLNQNIDPNAQ